MSTITYTTPQQIIADSIHEDRIVTVTPGDFAGAIEDLRVQLLDASEGDTYTYDRETEWATWEYWGTTSDGNDWRVHVTAPKN